MTILTTTKAWRREPTKRARLAPDRLSPEESANVRKAVRFLRTRIGGAAQLAEELGVGRKLIEKACSKNGKPGAGLAIRAARLAGVSVDALLRGEYPPEGVCAHCGR
jgi:DNA-binding phage protein